jgi:hypothetical protein
LLDLAMAPPSPDLAMRLPDLARAQPDLTMRLPDLAMAQSDLSCVAGCLVDADCNDPFHPRCDPTQCRCVECLPTLDNCGHALYCANQNGNYTCAPGCKDDSDCPNAHCDVAVHQCVICIDDADCALGRICLNDTCVPGCTAAHGCPSPLSCCGGACIDITSDFANCGGCGNPCPFGWNCCSSLCANPQFDIMNCGGCGMVCTVANGIPKCANHTCEIAACNPGFADCDGMYINGCETNLNDVNHCGNCATACPAGRNCLQGVCM